MVETGSVDRHVVCVGAGFAGLTLAKHLGNRDRVKLTVIDRRNFHLFQPLLYQVAMAGLSPAEIAFPIRSILSPYKNIEVFLGDVSKIDLEMRSITFDLATLNYDYLVLAAGANHSISVKISGNLLPPV